MEYKKSGVKSIMDSEFGGDKKAEVELGKCFIRERGNASLPFFVPGRSRKKKRNTKAVKPLVVIREGRVGGVALNDGRG